MTKREQYGLHFYKTNIEAGYTGNICRSETIGPYSYLQVLNHLDAFETQSFIDEINQALNGKYYEQYFSSDGVEADDVELAYPNVIINGNSIAMQDLKALLQEWLTFMRS